MDAALSGLRGREQAVLQRIINAGAEQTPQREAAITMLAATIVRSAQDAAIQDLFALTAERSPAAVAAIGRSARRGGGAARRPRCRGAVGCKERLEARRRRPRIRAVPDMSGRPRGSRRGVCVPAAGRLADQCGRARLGAGPQAESRAGGAHPSSPASGRSRARARRLCSLASPGPAKRATPRVSHR